MANKHNQIYRLISSIASLALAVGLSACAQKHSHMPPGDYMSQMQTGDVVRRLEAAEELDQSDARDPKVGVVAREDFLEQAGKADRAIKELSHGYPVSDTELEDALEIPPRGLSPADKSALISQIDQARAQTDHNEQAMLNEIGWGYSDAPARTSRFDQQKQFDDEVVKDLTIGEPVHWDDIRQATQVVQNPY
ncbi:MAG: hypothetical protein ABSG46_18425 [Candidatus Binataceae bacterium]|jgi:hypothetical protein